MSEKIRAFIEEFSKKSESEIDEYCNHILFNKLHFLHWVLFDYAALLFEFKKEDFLKIKDSLIIFYNNRNTLENHKWDQLTEDYFEYIEILFSSDYQIPDDYQDLWYHISALFILYGNCIFNKDYEMINLNPMYPNSLYQQLDFNMMKVIKAANILTTQYHFHKGRKEEGVKGGKIKKEIADTKKDLIHEIYYYIKDRGQKKEKDIVNIIKNDFSKMIESGLIKSKYSKNIKKPPGDSSIRNHLKKIEKEKKGL